jgi:methoxymalonate biosynthesis protein
MKTEPDIKCLIWDLDNTIWTGTLAEQDECRLKAELLSVLQTLDGRGILMSIASANDAEPAMEELAKHDISRYFLHPQISWDNKVKSITTIARRLDLSLNTIGFIDDEPFELAQVRDLIPGVRTYAADQYRQLATFSEFNPEFVSDESRRRREMYAQSENRQEAEKNSGINRAAFLKGTETRLHFRVAREDDFTRIMELMNRTSQLNATGQVYSPETVRRFLSDPAYRVYVALLRDRFVDYGKVGVAICRRGGMRWRVLSFLVSCRVLGRGVSAVFLNLVRREAHTEGAELFEACYMARARNRRILMLYTLNDLAYNGEDDNVSIYCGCSLRKFSFPKWLTVTSEKSNERMSNTVD